MKQHAPLARPWWLLPLGRVDARWWIPVALVVFAGDYWAGPEPTFPVLYCLAVFACAWYSGGAASVAFAFVAPLFHLVLLNTVWRPATLLVSVETISRGVLVALVTLWIARFAEHERAVQRHVQTLEGLLPICAFCKSIRNTQGSWEPLERYISEHSEAQFSHGFCPSCQKIHYPEIA